MYETHLSPSLGKPNAYPACAAAKECNDLGVWGGNIL